MPNKPYDNFFLANEIEDQYNSHLDLVQFCTVDNSLTGTAGMDYKVHVYKATDGTEKLTKGEGNTKTIEADFTEKVYKILLAQNRFSYFDEDAVESRTFNALGCTSANDTIKKLFAAFTERMRNDVGKKFQCIGFRYLADDEGVISLKNTVTDEGADPAALIPWVVGVAAGTAVNKSATNMVYDGEYTPDTRYTQTQLEAGIQEGSFMLHDVDGETRVLSDINTFVSITDEKGADFSSNQTIRVLDQIANDIAVLFGTKYLGKVPNDGAGRISLWNDIVSHHQKLQAIRALEDFDPEGITVEKGESKKSVAVSDHVTPVNAMEQLYMTVYVN